MKEDVEWVEAVDRGRARGAVEAAVWVVPCLPGPPEIAFARSAGTRNHTNVVSPVSSINARSVVPL